MDRSSRHDLAALVALAAAVLLAPVAVAALRLFPPLVPDEHGASWLLPLAGIVGVVASAVATLALLERGLRRGASVEVARAAALAFLAIGLAVATLRAAASPGGGLSFPDAGLAPAAIAAGGVLLVAQLARGASLPPSLPFRLIGTWVVLFLAIEAVAAVAVFLPSAGATWWPWLLGLAAALVAASAVPGPMLPAGVTAAGLVALAAARVGSLETVIGIGAVAAGALAYARATAPAVAAMPADGDADPADPRPAPLDSAAGMAALAAREESMRLARELRGTIDELMHARRTIEQQRAELAQTATVDALTGVATRRAILERLHIEAAAARRYQHPVALVLLDLDDFSGLNREHGIAVGDEVLREVALRLRLRVRSADALGRVGGDSFLALLPHTDETGAATFADALRGRLLSRPIETGAGELVVRISIGVAFMRSGMGLGDEELLAAADEALASARAAGGNRIAFDRAHGLIRLEERRARDGA